MTVPRQEFLSAATDLSISFTRNLIYLIATALPGPDSSPFWPRGGRSLIRLTINLPLGLYHVCLR